MASKASKQAPLAWKVTKRSGASRKAPASSGAGTQRRVKPRRAEAGKPEAKTDDGEGHTPVALWQTVEYQPRGQEKDKAVLKAFAFVEVRACAAACPVGAVPLTLMRTTVTTHRATLSSPRT